MKDRVTLEIRDDIALVTLNRPDKYNSLDMAMFDGIVDTIKKLKRDKRIRVVILHGAGKGFCAGLDVKSMMKNPLSIARLFFKPGRKISNIFQDVGYLWRELPVPVIAVTHGKCFGGGFQIALGADFRFATPDCEFSVMEMKWGLIPDMSGSITLRELVPIDVAKELTMTARVFDATEAKTMGLVTRVVNDPLAEAMAFAEELKTRSPDAVAHAKALFNNTWTADDKTALKWETRLQAKLIGRWNQRAAASRNLSDEPMPYKPRR